MQRGSEPAPSQETGPTNTSSESSVQRWWDIAEWWTDPRLAYARGLHDGYQLGRDGQDAIDDAVHRGAVRQARRHVDQADRRRDSDRGALAEYARRKGWAA